MACRGISLQPPATAYRLPCLRGSLASLATNSGLACAAAMTACHSWLPCCLLTTSCNKGQGRRGSRGSPRLATWPDTYRPTPRHAARFPAPRAQTTATAAAGRMPTYPPHPVVTEYLEALESKVRMWYGAERGTTMTWCRGRCDVRCVFGCVGRPARPVQLGGSRHLQVACLLRVCAGGDKPPGEGWWPRRGWGGREGTAEPLCARG